MLRQDEAKIWCTASLLGRGSPPLFKSSKKACHCTVIGWEGNAPGCFHSPIRSQSLNPAHRWSDDHEGFWKISTNKEKTWVSNNNISWYWNICGWPILVDNIGQQILWSGSNKYQWPLQSPLRKEWVPEVSQWRLKLWMLVGWVHVTFWSICTRFFLTLTFNKMLLMNKITVLSGFWTLLETFAIPYVHNSTTIYNEGLVRFMTFRALSCTKHKWLCILALV